MDRWKLNCMVHFFIYVDSEESEKSIIIRKLSIIFCLFILTILGPNRGSSLTWYLRLRIAVDVAR